MPDINIGRYTDCLIERVLGKLGPCIAYSCIGYILPTIGKYMSVGFIYGYWVYSANNWPIKKTIGGFFWRVSVRPSGAGLGSVHCLEYTFALDLSILPTLCFCVFDTWEYNFWYLTPAIYYVAFKVRCCICA